MSTVYARLENFIEVLKEIQIIWADTVLTGIHG